MYSFTEREWGTVDGILLLIFFCARKSDYEIRPVARQLRITGLQADVQKENKIAEQLQK